MQPDQPNGNPYQFIMDPGKVPKKSLLPNIAGGGKNAWLMKLGFLVGGTIVFIMVGAVLVNTIFGTRTNVDDLVMVVQTEQEINRLSRNPQDAIDQAVKNAAANTYMTVASHQQLWISFLGGKGRKIPDAELKLKQNSQTTRRLTSAVESNTFDATFSDVMREQLQAYANTLKTAYDSANNSDEKISLNQQYADVRLLISQWPK